MPQKWKVSARVPDADAVHALGLKGITFEDSQPSGPCQVAIVNPPDGGECFFIPPCSWRTFGLNERIPSPMIVVTDSEGSVVALIGYVANFVMIPDHQKLTSEP